MEPINVPEPSKKSPAVESFLIQTFGFDRRESIKTARCVPVPFGCGRLLSETTFAQLTGSPQDNFFRDRESAKEYSISGMCQDCQDQVFGYREQERPDLSDYSDVWEDWRGE